MARRRRAEILSDLPGDHLHRFAEEETEGDLPEAAFIPRQVVFLDEVADVVDPFAQELLPLANGEALVEGYMDEEEIPDAIPLAEKGNDHDRRPVRFSLSRVQPAGGRDAFLRP